MRKQTVDTPRTGSWHTQVNQPGFVPQRPAPQRVTIRTVSAKEGRELSAILNGRG